jgi:hypothetical protein
MTSAAVQLKELDLSTRVPSFPGVYGAIVLPAKKGAIDKPVLITNENQFLNKFTPNGKVEIGYDSSFYSALSFLSKSNKLWVMRAHNGALFGGALVPHTSGSSIPFSAGQADPTALSFIGTQCLAIHGSDPGVWNNDIFYTIHNYATSPAIVKEPGAFLLKIFKGSNLNVPVEEWLLSRTLGHKDGYGINIFVEDALLGSDYVRAITNTNFAGNLYPAEQTTPVALFAGSDGSAISDSKMIAASNFFANKDDLLVTVIMDGGWATPAYQQNLDALCQLRKDCVAILSTPIASEASANYISSIVDYRKTVLNVNSSYSALYTPHAKVYDRFNDRNLFVSPDGYVAAVISETAANFEIWYPPAGFRRGVLNVLDLRRRFTQGEMDVLYDEGINPLRFAPGRGILIWGQKTLLARPSALDRLNVRLMLIVIEPAIVEALEDFLFELNDASTRQIASAKVSSYMDGIKARRGVYDFLVTCDDTNNTPEDIDNNRMNLDLYVKPTRAIEYIPFRVGIVSTGISFDQV